MPSLTRILKSGINKKPRGIASNCYCAKETQFKLIVAIESFDKWRDVPTCFLFDNLVKVAALKMGRGL